MEPTGTLSCRENMDPNNRSDSINVINNNPITPGYFRSSAKKEADKEVSQLITQTFTAHLVSY